MTDFEGWLRDRLHQVDLNITELAEALHTSRSTIYQWIDGKAKPLDATALELARILDNLGPAGEVNSRRPRKEESHALLKRTGGCWNGKVNQIIDFVSRSEDQS
jgi:DNA-binding XRE family transcriptional regulator